MKKLILPFIFIFLLSSKKNFVILNQDKNNFLFYSGSTNSITPDLSLDKKLNYIQAELSFSEIASQDFRYSLKANGIMEDFRCSSEKKNDNDFFQLLINYEKGKDEWICTPLSLLISHFIDFSDFSFFLYRLEKSTSNKKEAKKYVRISLAKLKVLEDLFFNFTKEKLELATPSSDKDLNKNKSTKLEFLMLDPYLQDHGFRSYFDKNIEKGVDFFRFCALPYKEIFKEYIELFEFLDQGNFIKAREGINEFIKKYSIDIRHTESVYQGKKIPYFYTDQDSFSRILSKMKLEQIKEIMRELLFRKKI